MRTETEMMNLILHFSKNNNNIRAVWINGSRVNPNVQKDNFQDYDVVFVVNEVTPFIEDKSWIQNFGEIAIMQEPEKNDLANGLKPNISRSYVFLMLFQDGNRIDLNFVDKKYALEDYKNDSLTVLLLDKDDFFSKLPEPNDSSYYTKKPTESQFMACCNEFWWCLQNVAKGIVRDELPYAIKMFQICHDELDRAVEWYIGLQKSFKVDAGKFGKNFKKYLTKNLYEIYEKTYSNSNHENLWNAIFTMCDLFRDLANEVAKKLGFIYNQSEDEGIIKYLDKIKNRT